MPTIVFSEIKRTQCHDGSTSSFTKYTPNQQIKTSAPQHTNLSVVPKHRTYQQSMFRNRKLEYEHARLYKLSNKNIQTMIKQKTECETNKFEQRLNKTNNGDITYSIFQNARLQT